MLATAGLNTALLGLLHEQARSASWVVLVGPLPPGLELEQLAAAARSGVPLLVVEPNPQRLERLQQDLELGAPLPLTLRSELLAAEEGEQCWYRYNDPRHSGTTPPELLQARLPNLRLESLDLRPALPLSAVLERWRAERSAQGQPLPEGNGVLLLPLPEASAVLAGAGPWLEQLAAVFLHGPASEELPAALEAQLAAACLQRETQSPELQLWRGSESLRLQKRLDERTQQRDQLGAERDQLITERDQLTAERNQLAAERDSHIQQLQDLTEQHDNLSAERNQLLAERDQLAAERDSQTQHLHELNQQGDNLSAERDQLLAERDQLTAERNQLAAERDSQAHHLQELTQQRDHLAAERDQLAAQKLELEQRLELINQEVDDILLLLDSAEMEPPPAEAPSAPSAEKAPQDNPAQA